MVLQGVFCLPAQAGCWEEQETGFYTQSNNQWEERCFLNLSQKLRALLYFHVISSQILFEYAVLLTKYNWSEYSWVNPQIKIYFPSSAAFKTSFFEHQGRLVKKTSCFSEASPFQPRADVTAHITDASAFSKQLTSALNLQCGRVFLQSIHRDVVPEVHLELRTF